MEIKSSRCSGFNHREFVLSFDEEIPKVDVDWLLTKLENSVANGSVFEDGQSIEFGPMLLRVELLDGFLHLMEPDFQNIPIEWKPGVSSSLRLLRLQKDVGESFLSSDQLDYCSPRQSCIVGIDVQSGDHSFVLERVESNGSESGWFFGLVASVHDYSAPDNLRRMSIYEALLTVPRIGAFLAMPPGASIRESESETIFSIADEELVPVEGSLLHRARS